MVGWHQKIYLDKIQHQKPKDSGINGIPRFPLLKPMPERSIEVKSCPGQNPHQKQPEDSGFLDKKISAKKPSKIATVKKGLRGQNPHQKNPEPVVSRTLHWTRITSKKFKNSCMRKDCPGQSPHQKEKNAACKNVTCTETRLKKQK